MASRATHEDAKLLLQLYDLRREKRLRQARDFVQSTECKFKDYKDFLKRYPQGSKQNTYVAMVLGYWEMACTLVAHGLIAEELFQSTNYEHVGVWTKLRPVVEGWRQEYHYDQIMANLQAVASRHPAAPSSDGRAGSHKAKNKRKQRTARRARTAVEPIRPASRGDQGGDNGAEREHDAEPEIDENED
jgi:hypothetical protein